MASDPTTAVALAASTSVGALLVSELSIPPEGLLAVGFFAATVGLLYAPQGKTRLHDAATFIAAMFCSAWIGAALGPVLAAKIPAIAYPAKLLTIFVGVLFHPLVNIFARRVLPGYADKLGAPKPEPESKQ